MKKEKIVRATFDNNASIYEQKTFKETIGLRYLGWIERSFISSEIPSYIKTVLDVGTGTGRNIEIIIRRCAFVYGVDISRGMLTMAKRRKIQNSFFVIADAKHLPFPSEIFDCVVCIRVLKYIPEWRKTIKEISRVLKPKGKLILTFPNILSVQFISSLRELYSTFRPWEVVSTLIGCGFVIMKIRPETILPFPLYKRIRDKTFLRIIIELERVFQAVIPKYLLSRTILISCIKCGKLSVPTF
ncbi:MAG: class I SAM-dependent methyltransferase [Nitrososphaerota archaeon]|nr:class I SAM-dependent methyltransferase [Candidatus Bathyarchaeota archaeon]MDW8048706.1 class I SAM-dependent methyltransferase [Nitrososphaerota archaeon]